MSTALAYEPAQPEEATAAGRPSLAALVRAQTRIAFAAARAPEGGSFSRASRRRSRSAPPAAC